MRQMMIVAGFGLLGLSACATSGEQAVQEAMSELNVIDESGLNDVMMTAADPTEAVAYFSRASSENPDRIDLRRGLASSLIRAGRNTEAVSAWEKVTAHPDAGNEDRVDLAGSYIRTNQWDRARATLDSIPPTYETFERYRLEAMAADAAQDWARADSYYETAAGLTTTPAGVLNNWGYSKLARGDYGAAERLFTQALEGEPGLFKFHLCSAHPNSALRQRSGAASR